MAKIKFKPHTCYYHEAYGYVMMEYPSLDVPNAVDILLRKQPDGSRKRVAGVPISELTQADPEDLWKTITLLDIEVEKGRHFQKKYEDLCQELVRRNIPH